MPDLSPDIVGEVVEACKAGVAEAVEALGRGIDAEVQLTVGEPGTVDTKALPDGFSGPGLAVVLTVGSQAALFTLPASSGLLPEWTADPDPTGQSKLTTLAQELGMILLPEDYMPEDFKAAWVKTLSGALARGGVADGASLIPLELEGPDGKKGQAALIWPATKPESVIGAGAAKPEAKAEKKAKPAPQPRATPGLKPAPPAKPAAVVKPAPPRPVAVASLPQYSRSLLRIQLPVVVSLADKRQLLGRIMELGPGAIIQFDKSCEEMLELEVGGQRVATGEAVKVGDKFGLRINTMILPEERFAPVRPNERPGNAEPAATGPRVI
jgi:flagellar motor switch protein FliN/FliY